MLSTEIINFGKQMDAAQDKQMVIDLAEGATKVLDLGAGTGSISREIANKWNISVDAVDLEFKSAECVDTKLVKYHKSDIVKYLETCKEKYDYVILSAILHEVNDFYIQRMLGYLQVLLKTNARIIIREPFVDNDLGPITGMDNKHKFAQLVTEKISMSKALKYFSAAKKDGHIINHYTIEDIWGSNSVNAFYKAYIELVNLCFTMCYGEEAWVREKAERRFARDLDWCKKEFNFSTRTYTGFQVFSVLDKSYRELFKKAGFPPKAFDLLNYTGMIVVIDYSKKED